MTSPSAFPVNERTYILEDTAPPASQPQLATPDEPPKIPPGLAGYEGDDDPKREKSSISFTSFNYINSIVGSGVIGMPFALHEAGFGVGLLLLVLVAVITDAALCLMIAVARTAGINTYQDLVRAAFGKPGFVLTSCLQFLYPFISLISYNIIVGDTLTKVLIRVTGISPESVLVRREFIMATTTLLITLPLSLYRNITRLAKISLVSVAMIVAIAVAMLVRLATMKDLVPTTEDAWNFGGSNLASAIGIMSFAFMCHHSSFLVYESLADNTQERWNKVTHISIGSSAILSLVFAVAGYLTFTGYTQGDVFENYCWGDDLMNICRGAYAVTILLTFPIECFVARDVLETGFFREYQPQPFFRHAALSVLIAILCMIFSLSTDCLGIVLEVNGIMCAIPLAYILPALCYIKVEEGAPWARNKWTAWGVATFGVVSMIVGMVSLFTNISALSQCSHGIQMPYCFSTENDTQIELKLLNV
ncbi:putative sodium-coupled neutral amino acid transporter 11 [Procambarus clarkii]|uniref:putative sodium-coupled neutral amino acid transporter 11 n=1 Tax=Procambarus clarkii TaxID=6728 RepID=UPI001E675FED|nr:putative sodium-coupled neutral amino acid transporter 11 [Procambarus clarkii]